MVIAPDTHEPIGDQVLAGERDGLAALNNGRLCGSTECSAEDDRLGDAIPRAKSIMAAGTRIDRKARAMLADPFHAIT